MSSSVTCTSSCMVERIRTALFILGIYDISVIFLMNPKLEECTSRLLDGRKLGGRNVLFFLTVPTRVSPFCIKLIASAISVKQLSMVMLLSVLLNGADNSRTTFCARPRCGAFPCFPKYGLAFSGYNVLASHTQNIFMPYLSGLLGKYCLKGQRPRNGTSCSSTVRYSCGV